MTAKKKIRTVGRAENSEKVAFPHDGVIKDFFSEKETAKSFFQEYLPGEITANLDFDSLEIAKDTFVDKKLAQYYSDLLYHVRLNHMPAFIYLLIEHKSQEDPLTVFQLLKYMVRVWELYLKQNEKAKTLPVLLPIVIYHGRGKWKNEKNFRSLFNAPEYVADYIPDFCFNFQDISHLPDEEIKGEILLRILFMTLKYVLKPGLNHKLGEIFQLFLELKDKSKGTEYLEVLLRYLTSSARDLSEDALKESVTRIIEDGGELMATIAEKWMEKGMEKGMKVGVERGVKQTARRMLKDGLPVEVISKYTTLTVEEIESLSQTPSTH